MSKRPWKRERIIELPRSQRHTEPLPIIAHGLYCGACGAFYTSDDVFCGMCGVPLQRANEYTTLPFGLTVPNWQRR